MIIVPNPDNETDVAIIKESGDTRDNAWITLVTAGTKYSINLIVTDEGIVIDVYPLNLEVDIQPLATLALMEQDMLDAYGEFGELA